MKHDVLFKTSFNNICRPSLKQFWLRFRISVFFEILGNGNETFSFI